jgi:hypothetical protein
MSCLMASRPFLFRDEIKLRLWLSRGQILLLWVCSRSNMGRPFLSWPTLRCFAGAKSGLSCCASLEAHFQYTVGSKTFDQQDGIAEGSRRDPHPAGYSRRYQVLTRARAAWSAPASVSRIVPRPTYAITPAARAVPVHQEQSFPKLTICRLALNAAAEISRASFPPSILFAVPLRLARRPNARVVPKLESPITSRECPWGARQQSW